MQLFFSNNIINNKIILDKIETNHCINVLRHSIDDYVKIVDGLGNLYLGKISEISKNECSVIIENITKEYGKKDFYVHIAISPIKNHDRLEWFIEKAVEIGINEITFILCERTLRNKIRLKRIERVITTAMKQTLKAYKPKINPPINFNDFIQTFKNKQGYICYLDNSKKCNLNDYKEKIKKTESVVLIGPEGDFNKKEISLAKEHNILPISLGESRLRTETAGVVACHLINLINE